MKIKKGITLVFTGNGKGKTTASLGVALRALGWGYNVLMIQFMKSQKDVGELKIARKLKGFEIIQGGEGYLKIGGDNKSTIAHKKKAMETLDFAINSIISGEYYLIILDEIVTANYLGLIKEEDILALVKNKPEDLNLVLTGRGMSRSLRDAVDLVTEMKEIKHPFKKGGKAVKGIDY